MASEVYKVFRDSVVTMGDLAADDIERKYQESLPRSKFQSVDEMFQKYYRPMQKHHFDLKTFVPLLGKLLWETTQQQSQLESELPRTIVDTDALFETTRDASY